MELYRAEKKNNCQTGLPEKKRKARKYEKEKDPTRLLNCEKIYVKKVKIRTFSLKKTHYYL